MQTSTLPDLIRREGIPDYQPIFHFHKAEGKGVIEFNLPAAAYDDEAKPSMTPEEALKQLRALQIDIGRPTNSVKIVRSHRRERYPRRFKAHPAKPRRK